MPRTEKYSTERTWNESENTIERSVFTTDIPTIYLAQINTLSPPKKHTAVIPNARQKNGTPNGPVTQKPHRQSTNNVTLRRVLATVVAVEKRELLHTMCVCLQPELSSMQCACVILSHMACARSTLFFQLSHKRHDLKKLFYTKCMFYFLYNSFPKHFSF
jgi:hypothetical protein